MLLFLGSPSVSPRVLVFISTEKPDRSLVFQQLLAHSMDNYSQYANLPAATPPPGVVSNLDNPPSRALQLFIGMGTCIAATTVLLALRMYAKLVVTKKPGWEDCETHHPVIIQTLKAVVACLIGFVRITSRSTRSWFLRHELDAFCCA